MVVRIKLDAETMKWLEEKRRKYKSEDYGMECPRCGRNMEYLGEGVFECGSCEKSV